MENANLIKLSRLTGLRRKLDIIANNVANMNTHGFRGSHAVFEHFLMPLSRANDMPVFQRKLHFSTDPFTVLNNKTGFVKSTGVPTDVAVNGEGFFVVLANNEERFTRNGHFSINDQGQLVTQAGYPVLGAGGPVAINNNGLGVRIASDGRVYEGNQEVDRLRIVTHERESALRPVGEGLLAGGQPEDADEFQLFEASLEGSNVNSIHEMSNMISVLREYQSVNSLRTNLDEMRGRAISRLGSVQA